MLPSTPQELLEVLKSFQESKTNIPKEGYGYVLYTRKSTDDGEKQTRSLADQVLECREFALKNNLKIVGMMQESESAKQADIRPKFREMLEKIKVGKYDGILAWHPDRLARNMKDAGEIIDLVDKGIIKDLKFVSSYFENTATGKMMLGIAFVLSKQYSDHLSDSVSRGNRRSIAEGKYIAKPKHGYYKDSNQYLRPDGGNFVLIKNSFQMRVDGETLDAIAEYLNHNGYQAIRGDGSHRAYKMTKQRVEKILRDPTYTSILMHGKSDPVNLMDHYDFQPAVSVEDFMKINKLSSKDQMIRLSRKYKKGENVKADLMRGMIICSDCGEIMTAGITAKKTGEKVTRYFYYRCETDDCLAYGKSVRAKVLVDFACNYLNQKPFSSVTSYNHYVEELKNVSHRKLNEARSAHQSLQGIKRKSEEKLEKIKDLLISQQDERIKIAFRDDFQKVVEEIAAITNDLERVEAIMKVGKDIPLAYQDFLELMENMPTLLRLMTNMNEIDYILKKIFLNFTLKNKKVIKSTLNSPFDKLETLKVSNGGRGET